MERLTKRLPEDLGVVPIGGYGWPEIAAKLAQYEDAKEQGRLIVLPCIVGDIMYYIYGGYYKPKELCTVSRPCKVKEISIKIVKGKMNYGFILDNGSRYSFSSIGKTVFFSREEAEKALAGEVSK